MTVARRYIISGRVQGVGYRYFAVRAAERLGVAGTVRNLADGSVEAVAEAAVATLIEFRAELERGPRFGRVDAISEEPTAVIGHTSFQVMY